MKKRLYYILSFVILFSIASCSDFLEKENLSNVDADTYYKTSDGYEALVNACYSNTREIYGHEAWMFCAGTDMYVEGRDAQPEGLSEYRYLTSSDPYVYDFYCRCYAAIKAFNMAEYYNSQTEQTDVTSQRLGEILYLRGNTYFLLVQTFGGVGMIKDMLQEPMLAISRSSAEEVYNEIIVDLEKAETLCVDESYSGRATKRAVQHLLAKVYLTRGYESFALSDDFSKAASYADKAINSEELTIPFADLWKPGNDLNSEVLFSVQYSEGSISSDPMTMGNKQSFYFGPYMGGSEGAGDFPYRSYTLCPTNYLLSLYEETDERWGATFMTTIYKDGYYEIYRNDDLTNSDVMHYYAPHWASTQADSLAYVTEHPGADFHYFDDLEASKSSNKDFESIAIRKFDDPSSLFSISSSSRDIVIARLSETYLIAAEAYYMSDPASATAVDRLNAVRERANASIKSSIDMDDILDERAMELAGEYHRWFDLKRTGTLVDRCVSYNKDIVSSDFFSGSGGEQKILRPIPQEALDLNRSDDYKQNPAYE